MEKRALGTFSIFIASVGISIILTILLDPLYSSIFRIYPGGWVLDFGTYLDTFVLVFVFILPFLYRTFSRNYSPHTLLYLVIVPLLLTFASGAYPFITGIVFIIVGAYLGKLIRKKIA